MRSANRRLAMAVATLLCASAQPGSALVFQEFGAFGERLAGQSSSDSSSTTIVFPGFLDAENAMSVVSRVGINVNADAAPGGTAVEVGLTTFDVSFALSHTQSFDLILDFALRGQLLRVADQPGCSGSVSLSDVSIPTLVRLSDGAAFPINVLLAGDSLAAGGTTAGIEVSSDAQVIINFRGEPVATEGYWMTFIVSATALSQSCEVSARFGAANGGTTNCDACEYPGFGDRALASDGIFVAVTKISLCGNGVANAGEDCDLGASNGAVGSCCTELCQHVFEGRICRPVADDCDLVETCTGQSGLCPEDLKRSEGSFCTSDDNDCTEDVCNAAAECVHVVLDGASCQNEFFCDGGEFCSPQGECVTLEPPPCTAGQTCDEENDMCVQVAPTPTATPNGTATAAPTSTATLTATSATPAASPPTATATRVPSAATATATASAEICPGDCNGDRMVAINELVLGVSIALGNQAASACPAFDRDGDGSVVINELVGGVSSALAGCPV